MPNQACTVSSRNQSHRWRSRPRIYDTEGNCVSPVEWLASFHRLRLDSQRWTRGFLLFFCAVIGAPTPIAWMGAAVSPQFARRHPALARPCRQPQVTGGYRAEAVLPSPPVFRSLLTPAAPPSNFGRQTLCRRRRTTRPVLRPWSVKWGQRLHFLSHHQSEPAGHVSWRECPEQRMLHDGTSNSLCLSDLSPGGERASRALIYQSFGVESKALEFMSASSPRPIPWTDRQVKHALQRAEGTRGSTENILTEVSGSRHQFGFKPGGRSADGLSRAAEASWPCCFLVDHS